MIAGVEKSAAVVPLAHVHVRCVWRVVHVVCALLVTWGAPIPSAAAEALTGAYRDNSGLTAGRFVWQPTLQARGSVVVVLVPSKRMFHVFRNGIEIGIARALDVKPGRFALPAVLMVPPKARGSYASTGLAKRSPAVGRVALPAEGATWSDQAGLLRLSDALAPLLDEALADGAVAVVADALDEPRIAATDWPLNNRSRLVAVNETAQKATDVLGLSRIGPQSRAPMLVISKVDSAARLLVDGRVQWTADVAFSRSDRASHIGTHVLSRLVAPSPLALAGRQYLAISAGTDDAADRVHGADRGNGAAVSVLETVRFADRDKARAADLALATPGATILLSDGPLPDEALGAEVALWSIPGETATTASSPTAKVAPGRPQTVGKPRRKTVPSARRQVSPPAKPRAPVRLSQPKRPFGPLDLPNMN